MQATLKSFKYALTGIKDALKSEPNLRFHFLAAVLVVICAIYLNFSTNEMVLLILTISFVIVLELINTIVEKIVNLHSMEISEEARAIKDMSAAVVLFGAITSVAIGLFLFMDKLLW